MRASRKSQRLEGSCPWVVFLLWAGLTIAPFHSAHWAQAQVLGIWGLRAFGAVSPDLLTYWSPFHLQPSPGQVPRAPRSRRLQNQAPTILLTVPAALWKEALWRSQKESFVHISSRETQTRISCVSVWVKCHSQCVYVCQGTQVCGSMVPISKYFRSDV